MEVKPTYLIMVTDQNNNKYYSCYPNDDGTFTVKYGRVGATETTLTYPMSKWNSQINSKLKKGYVDRSDLMQEIIEDSKVTVSNNNDFSSIKIPSVQELIKRLFDYSNKIIKASYKVTAEQVTQAMVDRAQEYIDDLSGHINDTVDNFNIILKNIFITIPRKMSNVKDYLAYTTEDYKKIIEREQDLLDTMRGQVYKRPIISEDSSTTPKGVETESVTMLDKMGIIMEEASEEDIVKIKKAMGDAKDKFYKAWKVTNKDTEERYKKFVTENNIGNIKLTCHGSRNQNWFNILKTGLKIRPAGAITTGSLFGLGLYFSNPDLYHGVAKSIGYTSLNGYWSGESKNCGFLAFFETALGDSYDVYSFGNEYNTFKLGDLKKKKTSAWHLWAHGKGSRNGGSTLINDEIVIYDDRQTTIRYLVEIR